MSKPQEFFTSVSSQASPSELSKLDHKIQRANLGSVYQCLEQIPKKWYLIGILLGLPKHKLDQIDCDYSDTPRKILEMIDVWIISGKICTWKVLVITLQDNCYLDVANFTKTKAFEVLRLEELVKSSSNHYWKEREAKRREVDDLFRSPLLKNHNIREKSMMSLHIFMSVPNTVSDEQMLKKINLYLPINVFLLVPFMTLVSEFNGIVNSLRGIKECLQTRAKLLTSEMNVVCDEPLILRTRKDYQNETKQGAGTLQNNGLHNENDIQEEEILQKMHEGDSYCEALRDELNSCLNQVEVALTHNKNMKIAGNLIKRTFKEMLLITIHMLKGAVAYGNHFFFKSA